MLVQHICVVLLSYWLAKYDLFPIYSQDSSFSFRSCLPSGWTFLLFSGAVTMVSEKLFLDHDNFWRTFCIHFSVGFTCFLVTALIMYVYTYALHLVMFSLRPVLLVYLVYPLHSRIHIYGIILQCIFPKMEKEGSLVVYGVGKRRKKKKVACGKNIFYFFFVKDAF